VILDAIAIYPVKSLRGIAVQEAVVEPWGLQGDRRWMVVDAAGRYLTQRDLPGMARIAAVPDARGITLSVDGMELLHVPVPCIPVEVLVWRNRVQAQEAGPDATAWLSQALGRSCRLVHMGDPAAARGVDPAYAKLEDRVSFADGFPVLVVNAASLDDLNARMAQPVPMDRFRTNLIVSGAPAWAEDGWASLQVGPVPFRGPKTCARCVVVTTDQATGVRPRDREPLRTLTALRRDAAGRVTFGMNLIPDGTGRIMIGMDVRAGRANRHQVSQLTP